MLAAVRGVARSRHEKSTIVSPLLLKVSSVAHMPFSTHSSNNERRREAVGPAVFVVLLLLGGGGVWLVSCESPPLGHCIPRPPVELSIAGGVAADLPLDPAPEGGRGKGEGEF